MSQAKTPFHGTEAYDCVVIGAGLAGLCTGALLAQGGWRVLVCEKQARPGGCCTSFRRGGYRFDVSVQSYSGCEPDGAVGKVLRRLGVKEEIEFRRLDPAREYLFPDRTVTLKALLEEYREHLGEQFPGERVGLFSYLELQQRLYEEIARLPLEIPLSEAARFERDFPLLTQYRRAALGDVIRGLVQDPKLRAILAIRSSYLSLPPSKASFIAVSNVEMNYFLQGVYVARGGAEALADVLVKALKRHGGQLATRTRIARIRQEDSRVVGVETDSGESIAARCVVGAGSMPDLFESLLNPALAPNHPYMRRMQTFETSASYFIAFWGVGRDDLGGSPVSNKEIFEDYDLEREHDSLARGELDPHAPAFILIPSLIGREAVPGEHGQTLCASVKAPYDLRGGWDKSAREALADRLFERARGCLSSLDRADIEVAETVAPTTIERWTGNLRGSPYGWAHTPGQVGLDRPGPNTPIEGLYLAGHWTRPGGGVASVFVSAESLVRRLLA